MEKSKYKHHVTVQITDKLYQEIREEIGLKHKLGSLVGTPMEVFVVHILAAIKNGNTLLLLDKQDCSKLDGHGVVKKEK